MSKSITIARGRELLDAAIPANPDATGRAAEWQAERADAVAVLDWFEAAGPATLSKPLRTRKASRLTDILVAAGTPYADAIAVGFMLIK